MAWQHSGLSGICARISLPISFYPLKRSLTDTECAEAARLFACLEETLQLSGGPYLFGRLSLADLMLVPTVVRLTRHHLDLASWPLSRNWSADLLDRVSVAEWMREADTLPHLWFDDYLRSEESSVGKECVSTCKSR